MTDWNKVWSSDTQSLFVDKAGVYPPELEVIEDSYVYCFSLERFNLSSSGKLVDDNDRKAWFEDNELVQDWTHNSLTNAAISCSIDPIELRNMFCSDDPYKLLSAYNVIIGHCGIFEFDYYPRSLNEKK